jgi:hypothetical protein
LILAAAFVAGPAAAAPRLTAVVEGGQIVAPVEGLPPGAVAELRLHSDRNLAVSHNAQVSSHVTASAP